MNDDVKNVLSQAETEAQSLAPQEREVMLSRIKAMWEVYNGEDRIVTSEEILAQLDIEPTLQTVSSGFVSIDKLTGGFSYEQLIVLSAAEKAGKTSFSLQVIGNMKQENPCCFLFEQSPKEIIRQMRDRGQTIPFFVTPLKNADNRYEWLEKRMLEAMVKHGSRVFLIDNMDWVAKDYVNKNQRTDEAIKAILLKLKRFCVQWQVVVILIAHVRKLGLEEIPQPNDIMDTGAFKQIADTVVILWRKVKEEKIDGVKTKALYRTNDTLVWVAENRRTGRTGYAQLKFDGKSFYEEEWDNNITATESMNDF